MNTIKLYIIDDEALILSSLTELLNSVDFISVIGASKYGMKSYDEIIKLNPDMVLLDLKLTDESGLELAEKIHLEASNIKVVILSGYCNENLIAMAMKSGASGYLTKGLSFDEFIESLTKVMNEDAFVACDSYNPFLEKIKNDLKYNNYLFILTKREKEVLELIANEHTTNGIADKLQISEKTVRNHKSNIMHKLNLTTDAALIKYAYHMAII